MKPTDLTPMPGDDTSGDDSLARLIHAPIEDLPAFDPNARVDSPQRHSGPVMVAVINHGGYRCSEQKLEMIRTALRHHPEMIILAKEDDSLVRSQEDLSALLEQLPEPIVFRGLDDPAVIRRPGSRQGKGERKRNRINRWR